MGQATPMNPYPSTSYSAALLAGGQSSRMGADKALLPWSGRRLLDRQVDVLQALGPAELIISGRTGVDYAVARAIPVQDAAPEQGPLAGLAAVLEMMTTQHVVLLAVDLPAMTAGFLQRLLALRAAGFGVVPQSVSGWEPMAAVYPREILPLVRRQLEHRQFALQRLIDAGVAAGLLTAVPVSVHELPLFRNLNTPQDLASFS